MSDIALLKKRIEQERKILDELVVGADDLTLYCIQSRKLDELVNKYYQLVKKHPFEEENVELSPTYPPLCAALHPEAG